MKKFLIVLFIFTCFQVSPLQAEEDVPVELKEVGIEEHLGDKIDLDLIFTNRDGNEISLKSIFDKQKPVILNLVYYQCPSLCNFLLNGFLDTLKEMEWSVGENFEVVTISIDHEESYELADKKRIAYLKDYHREIGDSWYFLTGKKENIKILADQIGFNFKYDQRQDEYAHSAAIFVLTPEGVISRYLYGISFDPKDTKLALLEAGDGKIGTVVDKLLLFCYHYDPIGKKYSLLAVNLMKIAAGLTVLFLTLLILGLKISKRKKGLVC